MNTSISQCQYLISLTEPIFAGLDLAPRARAQAWDEDGRMAHRTSRRERGFCCDLLGRSALCPIEWREQFNPGSQPSADPGAYPLMTSLLDTFGSVYTDLLGAAREADSSILAATNPFCPAQPHFPSAGDFVAYLISSHLAYHLGQLVAWRAAAGLGPLRRPNRLAA